MRCGFDSDGRMFFALTAEGRPAAKAALYFHRDLRGHRLGGIQPALQAMRRRLEESHRIYLSPGRRQCLRNPG